MVRSRVMLAAALLAATPSCSLALKTDAEQCTVDKDCAARGSAFAGTICQDNVCVPKPDPKWGCVGNVAAEPAGNKDTVTVRLIDLISMDPVQGVTLKLCNKVDPQCGTSIGTPTLGTDGSVSVTIASNVDAYLDVQSPNYVPSLVVLDHFAWSKQNDILLVPQGAVQGIAGAANVMLDPTKGLVLIRADDCQEEPTAGASMTISPSDKETRFFVINDNATQNATETDSSGNAGYANVDPGISTLTGTIGAKGKEFGKVTAPVRAGSATFLPIRPTSTL